MLEDLVWANGARIGMSLEVKAIVFWPCKGLCAKLTLCSDLVLAVFFSQMASQRVCSPKGLLTLLTSRHVRDK